MAGPNISIVARARGISANRRNIISVTDNGLTLRLNVGKRILRLLVVGSMFAYRVVTFVH